jgi:hypothetical protein
MSRFQHAKRPAPLKALPISGVAILFALFLVASSAARPAFNFVYDAFDDDAVDDSLWYFALEGSPGPTVIEANQRLEITDPAGTIGDPSTGRFTGGLTSRCLLRGDFDLQADYQLLAWPPSNGISAPLSVFPGPRIGTPPTSPFYQIERGSAALKPDAPPEVYDARFQQPPGPLVTRALAPTDDAAGRLRLVRTAGTLSSYYLDSGNWVLLDSGPTITQDVRFRVWSFGFDNRFVHQEVKVAFDNVVVNRGNLICPGQPVPIDIKPQSCPNPLNTRAQGLLPVAILGTPDFDVTQIDQDSIRLMGRSGFVRPVRSALEDVTAPFEPFTGKTAETDCTELGSDGYTDLTLKFDMQQVVQVLGQVTDRQVLVLTVVGGLNDGSRIIGEDVVVVLKK